MNIKEQLKNGWILQGEKAYDPENYVVVPKEPTEEMLKKGWLDFVASGQSLRRT